MNEVLKQRLVGALILVALGVIFWPIIFVEPERQPVGQLQGIPPQPKVSEQPVSPPTLSGLRGSPALDMDHVLEEQDAMDTALYDAADTTVRQGSDADAEPQTSLSAAPTAAQSGAAAASADAPTVTPRTQRPEPLRVDADGVPEAWILQVVSVSSEEKANALRDRLLGLNHKGYVKRVSSNGKTLYRVYIGPRFEQAKLEEIQPQIDAEFGVKSMIRRYVP